MTSPDYTDPAVLLPLLETARAKLTLGQIAETVEFQTAGGATKRITYTRTNMDAINQEITRCKTEIAKTGGGRPARFAITGG